MAAGVRLAATGTATLVTVAVPAVAQAPAAFVTVQLRVMAPGAPGVKVMLVVAAPAVMLPLLMVQA